MIRLLFPQGIREGRGSGVRIAAFLAISLGCLPCSGWCRNNVLEHDSHLYTYRDAYLKKFLNSEGYSKLIPFTIKRNAAGTDLCFISSYAWEILAVSTGSVRLLTPPSSGAILDENENFVAWHSSGVLNFRNGAKINIRPESDDPRAHFGVGFDLSGKYFFLETRVGITDIFATERPERSLAALKIRAARIFSKEKKLYVFGHAAIDEKTHRETILLQILSKRGDMFDLESEASIVSPSRFPSMSIIDVSPWSDHVLIAVTHDMPLALLNAWYLLDMRTGKLTKTGWAFSQEHAFFLQEDIIRMALSRDVSPK